MRWIGTAGIVSGKGREVTEEGGRSSASGSRIVGVGVGGSRNRTGLKREQIEVGGVGGGGIGGSRSGMEPEWEETGMGG